MKKTCLILAAFLALLILVHQINKPHFINRIRTIAVDVSEFPLKIFTNSIRGLYNFAAVKNRYEKKIAVLEEKIALLTREAAGKQEIFNENQRLKGLLSFKTRVSHRNIPAEVIGRDPSGLDSFIIIDKGARDGIAPDMSVAKPDGLVGRVIEVGRSSAKVMLLDDPNYKAAASIQRTREQGVLVGIGRGLCRLIYLAYDADVKPGDMVLASGLKYVFPEGLAIGEVIKVLRTPSSLYTTVVVRPSCNLFKLEEVLCIE